jgi:matrixin/carboxypeptidase family protein
MTAAPIGRRPAVEPRPLRDVTNGRPNSAIRLTRSMAGHRQWLVGSLVLCLIVAQGQPAFAYLKFGVQVGDRQVTLKWSQTPVRYFVSDGAGVPGVSAGDFQAAVARAFATWEAVPTAAISYQFGGFTASQPLEDDGRSTLGFLDRPDLDRVLASTDFLVDETTGALVESDIFFNAAFPWSVAASGEAGKFDVETIALHEIGHLSGLGHSALGETELRPDGGRRVIAAEAVMFPIAFPAGNITGRVLKADDIAGMSDVYPDGDFAQAGSISGRVTRNGQGLFGAHVLAFNPATGALVANFTLNQQGQFSIAGLSPGPHIVRVEPLDDADGDSFFDTSVQTVDVDFRVGFYNRLVVVPRAGDSGAIEIKVVRK